MMTFTLADPGGRPPNSRGPMILYAQNANFSHFFRRSLRSLFIVSLILIAIQWFSTPPPLTKSTPPLRSNPGSATDLYFATEKCCEAERIHAHNYYYGNWFLYKRNIKHTNKSGHLSVRGLPAFWWFCTFDIFWANTYVQFILASIIETLLSYEIMVCMLFIF